jgi:NTP pyrophosphatase (non-canonical NTP hydrolase)
VNELNRTTESKAPELSILAPRRKEDQMHIAEFQQWVREVDDETQWNCLTTPQLLSHLTEEVGELARSINRILSYAEEKDEHLANLGHELMDVFWFLVKISNRFDLDLDAETRSFVQRAGNRSAETAEKYRDELIAGLRSLDQELVAAKRSLDLS